MNSRHLTNTFRVLALVGEVLSLDASLAYAILILIAMVWTIAECLT
jgi:hypothetical protein